MTINDKDYERKFVRDDLGQIIMDRGHGIILKTVKDSSVFHNKSDYVLYINKLREEVDELIRCMHDISTDKIDVGSLNVELTDIRELCVSIFKFYNLKQEDTPKDKTISTRQLCINELDRMTDDKFNMYGSFFDLVIVGIDRTQGNSGYNKLQYYINQDLID